MERPIQKVPVLVLASLALAFTAQIALKSLQGDARTAGSDLPPAPSRTALRLGGFGDPIPVAKLLMLFVQSFDSRADNRTPYQRLNYAQLIDWLRVILDLDPIGQYPLMAASRIYAEIPDQGKQRQILSFIHGEFLKDPGRRWPWLANAALIAKHQLGDLALARLYAAGIQKYAKGDDIPLWARQMEAFILEDMNELEAAAVMIGGFIDSGMVKTPGELRLLEDRLGEIKKRIEHNK